MTVAVTAWGLRAGEGSDLASGVSRRLSGAPHRQCEARSAAHDPESRNRRLTQQVEKNVDFQNKFSIIAFYRRCCKSRWPL